MMQNVNLNALRVFLSVAESSSFLLAAEKLCISQPAISATIKTLEQDLDAKLFYRNNKGVELTANGEKLLVYVKDAYNSLLNGSRMLDRSKDLSSGVLVIGAQSHIVRFYLLDKIAMFRNDYPGINVKIIDLSTRQMLEELRKHSIDFIVDSSPIDLIYTDFIKKVVAYLETCFVASTKNKVNIKNIKDLEKHNIVLPLERSSLRKALEKKLLEQDVVIKPILEVETEELIIEAVKKNIGIGYIVKNAAKDLIEDNQIRDVNLNYALPQVEINLVYHEGSLNIIATTFIKKYLSVGDVKI